MIAFIFICEYFFHSRIECHVHVGNSGSRLIKYRINNILEYISHGNAFVHKYMYFMVLLVGDWQTGCMYIFAIVAIVEASRSSFGFYVVWFVLRLICVSICTPFNEFFHASLPLPHYLCVLCIQIHT